MIEVGSFISTSGMTQSRSPSKDAMNWKSWASPPRFQAHGHSDEFRGNDIFIPRQENCESLKPSVDGSIMTIYDAPGKGFTRQWYRAGSHCARAKTLLVHQKMFESRLFFVDKLIDMGAQIIYATPTGRPSSGWTARFQFRSIEMSSPDIRAGVALLIAALSAKGTSIITASTRPTRAAVWDERLRALRGTGAESGGVGLLSLWGGIVPWIHRAHGDYQQ